MTEILTSINNDKLGTIFIFVNTRVSERFTDSVILGEMKLAFSSFGQFNKITRRKK